MDINDFKTLLINQGYSKVLIVTTTFPPYPPEAYSISVGGATIDLISLSNVLVASGFDVSIIAFEFVGKQKTPDPPNIQRVGQYFPYSTGTALASGLRFISNEFFNPLTFLRLIVALKKVKPDLVIIGESYQFGTVPLIVCTLLKIPVFIRYDWICPSFPKAFACSFKYRVKNCGNCISVKNGLKVPALIKTGFAFIASLIFLIKKDFWSKRVAAVLAVNEFYKDLYRSYGVKDENLLVLNPSQDLITNTVDLNKQKQDTFFNVLYVGRLSKEKGVLLLLDAFSKVLTCDMNTKLIIAGDGPLRNTIEKFAKRHANNVSYLGWVDRKNLGAVYQNCSVVVIPSIVPEGHPIVADEAMQFNKPIIGFALGGLNEILDRYPKSKRIRCVSSRALAETIIACISMDSQNSHVISA